MDSKILAKMQGWTWKKKVDHSLGVIDQFLSRMDNKAYVSFSGGKDSSVLLDLCRIINPSIKAVFFNTGMEYPDIVRHVQWVKKQGINVEMVSPAMRANEIWEKYGFPLVSKEQAHKLWYMKNEPNSKTAKRGYEENSLHNVSRCFRFLVNEQFSCNNKCCDILKKNPSRRYTEQTGLYPIVGTMASESILRREQYLLRGGCNSFDGKSSFSTPLSIWINDDIWSYIRDRKIRIADIYSKGVRRTGCVCCGFGAHLERGRFDVLYDLYPKMYHHVMGYTNNGVTFHDAIRKVLAVRGLCLPGEDPQLSLDFKYD